METEVRDSTPPPRCPAREKTKVGQELEIDNRGARLNPSNLDGERCRPSARRRRKRTRKTECGTSGRIAALRCAREGRVSDELRLSLCLDTTFARHY